MDALLSTAIAGTARAETTPPPLPAAAWDEALAGQSAERRVLLAAGTRAIYRQAGRTPETIPAPTSAPAETRPLCAPGAIRLLERMLDGVQLALLPEALDRLHRAGLRVPPHLLPELFQRASYKVALPPETLAVIGERGRWLAAQHPEWRWAARALTPILGVPANAEELWASDMPAQRLDQLWLVRHYDPARGREWLMAIWKRDRADFRAEALGALRRGLSLDDEPFLEVALGDRSPTVRKQAAKLLLRLPDSALARRVRDRADTMLTFTPDRKALGSSGGKLAVAPPAAYDKTWERDGIEEKPPQGTGQQSFWLRQFMALVPPAHWSTCFAADPATLVAAAARTAWVESLIQGWSQATLAYQDADWAVALWRHHLAGRYNAKTHDETARLTARLSEKLPHPLGEQLVGEVLTHERGMDPRLIATIRLLPRPWSVPFARTLLAHLRIYLRDRLPSTPNAQDPWIGLMDNIAPALPAECFAEALALPDLLPLEEREAGNSWWCRLLEEFAAEVYFRQQLSEEIPL